MEMWKNALVFYMKIFFAIFKSLLLNLTKKIIMTGLFLEITNKSSSSPQIKTSYINCKY